MSIKITCEQAVLALKTLKTSSPATTIAAFMKTDSRAVATALRAAVNDGRVSRHYRKPGKGQQRCCFYRFVRLTPKAAS
jgi:hypothetical protein